MGGRSRPHVDSLVDRYSDHCSSGSNRRAIGRTADRWAWTSLHFGGPSRWESHDRARGLTRRFFTVGRHLSRRWEHSHRGSARTPVPPFQSGPGTGPPYIGSCRAVGHGARPRDSLASTTVAGEPTPTAGRHANLGAAALGLARILGRLRIAFSSRRRLRRAPRSSLVTNRESTG